MTQKSNILKRKYLTTMNILLLMILINFQLQSFDERLKRAKSPTKNDLNTVEQRDTKNEEK